MVKQPSADVEQAAPAVALEEFISSLFRMNRALRSTAYRWGQLPGGLKRSDVVVLRTLHEHGECRPGFIAEVLGVGPSVISRQLVALGEQQLILRRADPEDGRAELIGLTDLGHERMSMLRAAYIATLQERFADWDEDRVRAAVELLHDLADHLAPPAATPTGCGQPRTNHTNEKETA